MPKEGGLILADSFGWQYALEPVMRQPILEVTYG